MSGGDAVGRRIGRDHGRLAGRTGRGVRIAVIDSGVASGHPHVGRVERGFSLASDGSVGADFGDRIGHGTAVFAAIREKAPEAEIIPLRVFEDRLATSAETLARAIDLAVAEGARLLNLSLGTRRYEHEEGLRAAAARAREAGALVVSPASHRGRRWLPGDLPEAAGVELNDELGRHEMEVASLAPLRLRAAGLPRPIPGVPPPGNLRGISFAAANVTGLLARGAQGEAGTDWASLIAHLARG